MITHKRIVTWTLLFGFLLIVATGTAIAQTPPVENVTLTYLQASADDAAGVVDVSAYASVVKDNNQPLSGLTADNFEILEDSNPVGDLSVEAATDPMTVIFVIDTSGSMAAAGPDGILALDAAKQAATSFIQSLASEDQVAVYYFNDEVYMQQDLTPDHNAAINGINALTWKDFGGTCLYDATAKAVKKAAQAPPGRRAVLVLTDGVDEKSGGKAGETCSVNTLNDVIDLATVNAIKVPVFAIGFGDKVDEAELLRLAGRTGGQGLVSPDSTRLTAMFDTVAGLLKNQYLLRWQTQTVSGEHAVVVKVKSGGAQAEDTRRVFVPAVAGVAAPPTPAQTLPEVPRDFVVTIAGVAETDIPGEVLVTVGLPENEDIVRTTLAIDDKLIEEAAAPKSEFVFKPNEIDLLPGKHIIRVEVENGQGIIALDKRELTIPNAPGIDRVTVSEPEVTAPGGPTGQTPAATPLLNPLTLAGIGIIGLIVLLLLVFGIKALTKPKKKLKDDPLKSGDDGLPTDDDKTTDYASDGGPAYPGTSGGPVPAARLVVVQGVDVQPGQTFHLPPGKASVLVGREAAGVKPDISIPDKPVSRRQAEIRYRAGQFTILDLDSSFGTYINGQRVYRIPQPLPNAAEVQLGKRTIVRFEVEENHSAYSPDATRDVDIDPDKTQDEW